MFYSVHKGREKGIYHTWDECKLQINGFQNPIYKKFKTLEDAQYFMEHGTTNMKQDIYIPKGHKIVFTDGSCRNKEGNKKAGCGIYFGKEDPRNISRRLLINPTNNRAELSAILECLQIVSKYKEPYIIITDSKYSYDCLLKYSKKWEQTDWITIEGHAVKNRELIEPAYNILKRNKQIGLRHVNSHTGYNDKFSIGNYEADKLANKACI